MMTNDIVSKIAQLVAQRELSLNPKENRELKSKKGLSAPQDTVNLTSAAKSFADSAANVSEYEKEQYMKVERLKALVGGGSYKVDDAVLSSIAERIANTLI
jgi:anti-sigma28 factor (negative regulator of flagellin synthesis)